MGEGCAIHSWSKARGQEATLGMAELPCPSPGSRQGCPQQMERLQGHYGHAAPARALAAAQGSMILHCRTGGPGLDTSAHPRVSSQWPQDPWLRPVGLSSRGDWTGWCACCGKHPSASPPPPRTAPAPTQGPHCPAGEGGGGYVAVAPGTWAGTWAGTPYRHRTRARALAGSGRRSGCRPPRHRHSAHTWRRST